MSQSIKVAFQRLDHGRDLPLPAYQTPGAVGMDICAALTGSTELVLAPGSSALVPTGFALALPEGFEAQIRPRSGLAVKHAVTVTNAPGTIDWDYRGEVKVPLINLGAEVFTITHGLRIAQMVFAPVMRASLEEVETLDATRRGAGGFGSTGGI